jgi:type II secretory pathway component PulF
MGASDLHSSPARAGRGWAIGSTAYCVKSSRRLAEAMAAQQPAFTHAYVGMVRAGEVGVLLQVMLARIADFLARSEEAAAPSGAFQ